MKKIYMTMIAMLCGVAAMAQGTADGQFGNYLYVENIKVDAGTTNVEVPVCMKNASDEITAVSFILNLPDNVSLTLNKKGKIYVTVDEDRMDDHVSMFTPSGENQMITVYSGSVATFYENDGPVVWVPLTIAEDGEYVVALTAISIADTEGNSVADFDATEFTLTVGEGTGINSINADDVNAPVYNVAGQRVSKAQKGIFIQNGKKVAVK